MNLNFTPSGIEAAYRLGIFPMHNEWTGGIDWYRPDPRTIIPLDSFHISRSLAKVIRQGRFNVTFNQDFQGVMKGCANREEGTWISDEFMDVYGALHRRGRAHSVEVWKEGLLVGGTYGVAIGAAFMAESMFHTESNASKVALASLVDRLRERSFEILDTQYLTPHLASLGAVEIPHRVYAIRLAQAVQKHREFG